MGHADDPQTGPRRVITDEELDRIRISPKSWPADERDPLDQSVVVPGKAKGDVNRRRSVRLDCDEFALWFKVRIDAENPDDYSILMMAEIGGTQRCLCRIDSKGNHPMKGLGLPPAKAPHMHRMKEVYQRMGLKDDVWAEHIDIGSIEDAERLLITFYNIKGIDGNEGGHDDELHG